MHSLIAMLIRGLLAITLVTGGLSAWSMNATSMAMGLSSQAAPDISGQQDADNHHADSQAAAHAPSEQPQHDCCEDQEGDCAQDMYEKCDCVCPALSIFVPVDNPPAITAAAQGPVASIFVSAPQRVITTLLRPPRA
ncbi:MAG: hypothetical protein HND55_09070 [Pseudomonadota bacterium]|nr:MAG: hypothetical protein HND55_09070 [Pseudomonadota bacterium]